MAYAIKAEIPDPTDQTFVFPAQKTMYGGKRIAAGDTIFLFASETEGGQGLVARGIVTSAEPIAPKPGIARQTPRVSIIVRRTALVARALGRRDLRHMTEWMTAGPKRSSILNFTVRPPTRSLVSPARQWAS